jgi:predicted MFS family arabinose efflux permease
LLFQICHFGSFFLICMYLQEFAKMSVINTGLIIGMQAFGAISSNRYSAKLFHHYGPTLPISIGFCGLSILSPLILFITAPQQVLFGGVLLFIRGLFSGLCGTPIQTMSVIAFKKEDIGNASAVFNAGRQVSISVGIAIFALFISFSSHDALGIMQHKSFLGAFLLIPVLCIIGIIVCLTINNKKIIKLTQSVL